MKTKIFRIYLYNALINFSIVSIIQNLYFSYVGFDFTQIGILLAILHFGKMFFEIPTGYIADRFGNKASVIVSLILQIMAYAIMSCFTNFICMVLVLIILSISYTMTTGCVDAIIVNTISREGATTELVKVNAINRIIHYISYGLAGVFAGFIAEKSYFWVFWVNIAFLVACIVVLLHISDESIHEKHGEDQDYKVITVLKYIVSNKYIFYFTLIESSVAWAMIPVDSFYSNYLSITFNMPVSQVGIIVGIQFVLISFVGLYSKKISLKLKSSWLLRYGPIAMIVAFLLFSISNISLVSVLLYMIGLGIFCLYSPIQYKAMHENINPIYRVTVISVKSFICAGLSMISQPIMGYISDVFGMQKGMQILIFISLIFLIFLNIIFRRLNFADRQSHKPEIVSR